MNMTDAEWNTRTARLKDLNSACYDLFLEIAELLGAEDYPEPSEARVELLRYVMHLPRFNREARRRALSDPL